MNHTFPGLEAFSEIERSLAGHLLEQGIVSADQISAGIAGGKVFGKSLHLLLIESGADAGRVARCLAGIMHLDFIDLETVMVDPSIVKIVPESLSKLHSCIVVGRDGDHHLLAMADPLSRKAIEDAELLTDARFKILVTTAAGVARTLERVSCVLPASNRIMDELDRIIACGSPDDQDDSLDPFALELGNNESPIVRLANLIFTQAITDRIPEVLVRTHESSLLIEFRKADRFEPFMTTAAGAFPDLARRFRKMSHWPKAQPEDGFSQDFEFPWKDEKYKFSVSITTTGSSCEIRLISR